MRFTIPTPVSVTSPPVSYEFHSNHRIGSDEHSRGAGIVTNAYGKQLVIDAVKQLRSVVRAQLEATSAHFERAVGARARRRLARFSVARSLPPPVAG